MMSISLHKCHRKFEGLSLVNSLRWWGGGGRGVLSQNLDPHLYMYVSIGPQSLILSGNNIPQKYTFRGDNIPHDYTNIIKI